MTIIFFSN